MVDKKTTAAAKTAPKKAPATKKVAPVAKKVVETKKAPVAKPAAKVVKTAKKTLNKDGTPKKEYKKKAPGKPIKGMKRERPLLSGKFALPKPKPRTLVLSNLEKTVTPKDIREMLKYHLAHIKSVRMIMRKKVNKKTIKDKDGKIIPQKIGSAFVTFRTMAARKQVQKKKFSIGGRPVRVALSKPNPHHIRRMEKQAALKKERTAKLQESKKEIKAEMHKNLLKNQKKSGYKKREAAKRKSVNRAPKADGKRYTVLRCRRPKQERRPLSGSKAAKARARMTRK